MKRFKKSGKVLYAVMICLFCIIPACRVEPQEITDSIIRDGEMQFQDKEDPHTDVEQIAAIYHDIFDDARETDKTKGIIRKLGENGYAAVDSANQVDMTNSQQVLAFCDAVDAKEKAELTIIEVMNEEVINEDAADGKAAATYGFRKYNFQAENGSVDIVRGYYRFDALQNLVCVDVVSYRADLWEYTAEGYLVFEGNYFADDYYMISLTDELEHTALRVAPLDPKCRDLYQKYIQPIGYECNNLFLVNWSEEDFARLDMYDLFDMFYPMIYQKPFPYTASKNPGIGLVYRIAEREFESVINTYLDIDIDALRAKTDYFPQEMTYGYKPRGFYELGSTNMPYPEVVRYTENSNHTITLTVNAVFPYECTSKAFSHEVVIRALEDGSFQYVSNNIIEGNDDTWWRAERLTDSEWEEVYGDHNTIESDDSLWYLPHADDCVLTESERQTVNNQVLAAAEQVREVYQDMEIEEGASYASNVKDFNRAQCKEVAALLGKAGFISITEDTNMENYQDIEAFYTAYKKGHDAQATIYNVNRDGLIEAITFIYKKDVLQTYYVGIGWQKGGVPILKNTLVNDISEMHLTEKGYLIYTYKEQIVHSDACQYWRVKPLSEKCRELTRKYIAGISFTNYNAFVTNWNSSNVEEILMPCMFEDIYRMDMGENTRVQNDRVPAGLYERIMRTYFPVSQEQLRSKCGYDAGSDSYPYEMIFATPYAPFGEVVDYTENEDGTITLFVDGVWIDNNSDCAFASEIVVKPFSDGTFRYLSNKIQTKELPLPAAAIR